jgi:stearoyl-CoA desaturase (delta-9 desaturase)
MVLVHGLAASSLWLPWPPFALPVVIGLHVSIMLGTTVGLHRLLSHRAFRCPRWAFIRLLRVCGLAWDVKLPGQRAPEPQPETRAA